MKRISLLFVVVLVLAGLVACSSTGGAPKEEPTKVIVTVGDRTEGFKSLEAAVRSVKYGETALITVNGDITVSSEIVIDGKSITITDGGVPVRIKDGISEKSQLFDWLAMIVVSGTGELTLQGTADGMLTFQGAGSNVEYQKRVMFNIGFADAKGQGGKLTVNDGVVVTGYYSTTAGIIRNYNEVTINGGVFKDNSNTQNGTVCITYGSSTLTVNGGQFINNKSTTNAGAFQVTDEAGATMIVTGGLFQGNQGKRGAAINSYAKSTVTISGGTFTDNIATEDANGAGVYCMGKFLISGGTFSGNKRADVYKGADTVIIEPAARIDNLKSFQ